MIERMFPLTKNKMMILKEIYEAGETHLLDISSKLGLHPYSVQKTLSAVYPLLEREKSGKTIVLKIDMKIRESGELLYLIEDYKVGSCGKKAKTIITNIQTFFSKNENILACCLFGSYAREAATEESDIDLLFIAKRGENEILRACRDISSVVGKKISPIILTEKEFFISLKSKEPTMETILKPSQRLLLIGKEYFLRNTRTEER